MEKGLCTGDPHNGVWGQPGVLSEGDVKQRSSHRETCLGQPFISVLFLCRHIGEHRAQLPAMDLREGPTLMWKLTVLKKKIHVSTGSIHNLVGKD